MSLLHNGTIEHTRIFLYPDDIVRFNDRAPRAFREQYPNALVIEETEENDTDNFERDGLQTLTLRDIGSGNPVCIGDVVHFSSDFFSLDL